MVIKTVHAVWFSATGTTEKVVTAIAGAIFSHALVGLYTYIVSSDPDIPDEALCRQMDNLMAATLG